MEQKSISTETRQAYGKDLPTPIKYTYSWQNYATFAELQQANATLTADEQVKARNNMAKAKARANALNAALEAAGIEKPTIENDDQMRLREMFKTLMSSKRYTEEAARELAASTLGLTWEEEE